MNNRNNLSARPIDWPSLTKHLIFGAMVGLAVISLFVFGADNPKPEWGTYWRIRPLIITPLSGAAGGAVFYFMAHIGSQRGWSKASRVFTSIVIAFIGLWMGIVLGLDGTLWD